MLVEAESRTNTADMKASDRIVALALSDVMGDLLCDPEIVTTIRAAGSCTRFYSIGKQRVEPTNQNVIAVEKVQAWKFRGRAQTRDRAGRR